jgi:hypothetical protein
MSQAMKPTIETLNLFKLASGDQLSLQVYKFIGKKIVKKFTFNLTYMGQKLLVME